MCYTISFEWVTVMDSVIWIHLYNIISLWPGIQITIPSEDDLSVHITVSYNLLLDINRLNLFFTKKIAQRTILSE